MFAVSSIAFKLGSIEVHWYGILIVVALILGVIIAYLQAKKRGYDLDYILDFALLAVPLAIVGARAYYVIFAPDWLKEIYWAEPVQMLYVWNGGLAIYGAVIGGVIAGFIYAKWKKINVLELFDIAAPSLILGQAIGRWGNFFNQEAYGFEVTNTAWQWFPFAVWIEQEGSYHLATFFYESLWNLLVFLALLWIGKKKRRDGTILWWYLMLYGVGRLFIEGLRTDSLLIGDMMVSQWLSGILVIASACVLIIQWYKSRKANALEQSVELADRLNLKPALEKDSFDAQQHEERALQEQESATQADEMRDEDALCQDEGLIKEPDIMQEHTDNEEEQVDSNENQS